jgi:hypothetical protein
MLPYGIIRAMTLRTAVLASLLLGTAGFGDSMGSSTHQNRMNAHIMMENSGKAAALFIALTHLSMLLRLYVIRFGIAIDFGQDVPGIDHYILRNTRKTRGEKHNRNVTALPDGNTTKGGHRCPPFIDFM